MLLRLQQAHDKYFKLTFARARNAADLLCSVLPPALAPYLDVGDLKDAREASVRASTPSSAGAA